MGDNARPRLSDPVQDLLEDVMEDYDLNTYDQAIRHLAREAGHNV